MKPNSSDAGAHLDAEPGAPGADSLEALIRSAEACRAADDLAHGLHHARRAWAVLAADDTARRLRIGLLLVHFHYRKSELVQMVERGLDVLPLLRAQPQRADELIDLLRSVALSASDCQRFDVALACAQEAQALALARGDTARLSLAVNALGCLFERLGDPWQGERLLRHALTIARSQPDPAALISALNNLAGLLMGRFYLLRDAMPLSEAREPLLAALPFAEEAAAKAPHDNVLQRVYTQNNLGELRVLLGDAEGAQAALDTSADLAQRHGFGALRWRLGFAQGLLHLLRGQHPQARSLLLQTLEEADADSHPIIHMRLHHALWRCALDQGQYPEAARHLERYMQLERQRSISQLRAQSELFVTRAEVESLQHEARREQQRSRELEADARRDQLTGLSNRRELDRRWPDLIDEARRLGTPLSVAMLDLDHFKQVNDRFGHAVGDEVLTMLADLLRAHTRETDLAVRVGGEEFLLVLPDTAEVAAAEVCERVRQRVAAHRWSSVATGLQVTISGGLCSAPAVPHEQLRQRADEALYSAKHQGRNRVVQYGGSAAPPAQVPAP